MNEAGNTTDARTTERGYLSIGEVLLLLQDEFPDVTISKIRFLESQGLIEPERTPSGYRKFFDTDVERLRYILREQKDHYLPLRVIKHRLDTEPTGPVSRLTDPTDPDGMAAQSDAASRADDEPPGGADPESAGDTPGEEPALVKADLVNADEVRRRTGVTANELRELEQYGIIGSRLLAGEVVYAPGEIEVTRMAVPFLRHGVEPRHLRMYRQAIEREIALFEQIVMPFVKQRNPHARKQAVTTLEELAAAGGELRAALVRNRLQALLEG